MRLLNRHDASLAVALLVAALVVFQKPLGLAVNAVRDVEERYDIDLVAGLVVLAGAFALHQHRKRQGATAAAALAATEARHERQRSAELERLVALGGALSAALDVQAVQQVFWRYLPAFARDRGLWMLTRTASGWEHVIRDATEARVSPSALEAIAAEALTAPAQADAQADGVVVTDVVCFPMVVGDAALGIIGVRNAPPLSLSERRALGTAVALLAISFRNVELLASTRESSLRDPLTAGTPAARNPHGPRPAENVNVEELRALQQLAATDPLTGLANRRGGEKYIANEISRAKRERRPLSCILLDVDRFKQVNDTYGHQAGDQLLRDLSNLLRRTVRAYDILVRWGGEEFLLVLPGVDLEMARVLAERVRIATEALDTHGIGLVTISAGVASFEPDYDFTATLRTADQRLYQAKSGGRNKVV